MATTIDARALAGTLFEALTGEATRQLQQAAARLGGAPTGSQEQILAAMPDALPQVRNFVLGLAQEGLLDQLGAVAAAFATYAKAGEAPALDAEVTSAVALSEPQRQTIMSDLQKRYGANLAVSFSVDPSLIGGLVIRVGDQVLDNSLRARLGAIQRNMLAS